MARLTKSGLFVVRAKNGLKKFLLIHRAKLAPESSCPSIDTRLTQESQRHNGYNPDPEAALAARRKEMAKAMETNNPGKSKRMEAAINANGGTLPRNWQDQPDMEDASASGRVRMS